MRSLLALALLLVAPPLAAAQAPWQIGPCGRGGLCAGAYTPLPTPTRTPTPDPNAPTPTPTATATITRTPVPLAVEYRLNAGASGAYTDAQGRVWSADQVYGGGIPGLIPPFQGQAYGTGAEVLGTQDPALYQALRQATGPLRYRFEVPAGAYQLTFKFAEFVAQGPGERLLTLKAQSQVLRAGLDLYAEAGPGRAHDLSFDLEVAEGSLEVELSASVGRALLNALELRGLQAGPAPMPSPTPTFTPNPTPLHIQLLLPPDAVEMP